MNSVILKVDGMGCGSCVQKVKAALAAVPDARVEAVEVGSVRLASDTQAGSVQDAISALARIGFNAHVEQTPVGAAFAGGGCCRR